MAVKLVAEIYGVDAITQLKLTKEQLMRLSLWKAMEDIGLADGRMHTFDVQDIKIVPQTTRPRAQQELRVTATIHYWLARPQDAENGDVLHVSALSRGPVPETKDGQPAPEPDVISVESQGKRFIYAEGEWHCQGPVKAS